MITLLQLSVDEAVKCLSQRLLTAAQCMVTNVYTGPRQSVWFDCECKTQKREMRKWYGKFRRVKRGAEQQKIEQNTLPAKKDTGHY